MSSYKKIGKYYEKCFKKHGDTPQGLAWPNETDMNLRYRIMCELMRDGEGSLLDLGCGTGNLKSFVEAHYPKVKYTGADISSVFISHCREKYPDSEWLQINLIKDDIDQYDYIIMNGIFTVKDSLTQVKMLNFFKLLTSRAFSFARKGIAFNVMSKLVDWEREDLFHVSMDELGGYLAQELSRNFIFRNDYGLYEYTTYVYKQPNTNL